MASNIAAKLKERGASETNVPVSIGPSLQHCKDLKPLAAVLCHGERYYLQYPITWLHELGHNLYMNHAGSVQDDGSGSLQVGGFSLGSRPLLQTGTRRTSHLRLERLQTPSHRTTAAVAH